MWNNSLYGNYRNRKFSDIWGEVNEFTEDYNNSGLSGAISDDTLSTLYYLLYARYGNSTIASSDENQFKYKVFSTIFMYGPTWEKRLEVQTKLRELSEEDLLAGTRQINNHSWNPSSEPSTSTLDELPTTNEQTSTKYKKSKLDAYAMLTSLLETDVTEEFIGMFKKLFLTVVEPELPLWYVTELNMEGEN